MRVVRLLLVIGLSILPSVLKLPILRLTGAKIGKGCYIGFSIINARTIEIGDHVNIGHMNLIWNLKTLSLATGSKIGDFNWIAGGGIGALLMGRNCSIRRFHFLEASGNISMGANSILAGRSSKLFTHGLSPSKFEDIRPIEIAEWCYVGAGCSFVPGANVAKGTFVGMGAVVSKPSLTTYILLAGNPAVQVKTLDPNDTYFIQPFLRHAHHPDTYAG
ncbi:acyltransferase [Devosia sp. CAU 1758]